MRKKSLLLTMEESDEMRCKCSFWFCLWCLFPEQTVRGELRLDVAASMWSRTQGLEKDVSMHLRLQLVTGEDGEPWTDWRVSHCLPCSLAGQTRSRWAVHGCKWDNMRQDVEFGRKEISIRTRFLLAMERGQNAWREWPVSSGLCCLLREQVGGR